MDLADKTCREFTDELASRLPVPSGGGTSSLVGALGIALGNMVGSLTSNNPKYADVKDDMDALNKRARDIWTSLLDLVEADADAVAPLSRAYGMPYETDDEAADKARVMEECLKACCAVPLQTMELCCEAIELHEQYASMGAAIAISDVGCGVAACKSALQAASLNVAINTKYMQDRTYAMDADEHAAAMLAKYVPRADAVFSDIAARLK
ncbi:MAG: cyclodeaminase/cyclohydrolase family protein [Coriobacteriales bacterium]|jgi:formiminotetrahydrofolate cyclodeaminase|nr:cyclodeaminase/cyclohydrolase family protein [Coriobacteriales bacterium]